MERNVLSGYQRYGLGMIAFLFPAYIQENGQAFWGSEKALRWLETIFDESGNMIGAQDSAEVREYKKACEAIERMKNDRTESP